MSLAEITEQVLALPVEQRARLAQTLWESLETADAANGADAIADARRRDAELQDGRAEPRSHQEVMQRAREAIQCTSVGTRKPKPR